MSVYLDPTEENLRNVLQIIKDFQQLSGLKISVSKTKAIWFGSKAYSSDVLCPEETLIWDCKFRLLGIDFTADLTNMEKNYYDKIKEVRKLLNSWAYRHLTPYGKVVVIKTLVLSKLANVAMVVPDLPKVEIDNFEKMCFSFLWNNKPPKVCKTDAILPEKKKSSLN